jgi:O-antigen/teichoic acid export membrane protein
MLKQALVASFAVFVGMLLQYVFHFSMTRFLATNIYGELAVVIGILSVVGVPASSIQTLLTREIAKLDKKKKQKEIVGVVKKYSRLVVAAGLVAAVALFFASYLISWIFNDPQLVLPMQIIAIGMPFLFLAPITQSYYQGREKIGILSAILIISPAVKLVFAVGIVLLGFGLLGATASLWIGSLFAATLLVPVFMKNAETAKEYLKIHKSFILILATGVLNAVFLYLDLFFVRYHLGADDAGFYNVASITAKVLLYSVGGVTMVFLPKSSKLHFERDKKQIKAMLAKSILLILPVFIIFVLFPSRIISFFYTSAYLSALQPFIILSIGMFALSIFQIFLNLMWSQHMEKQPLILMVAVILIDTVLLSLLTPIGMSGAAIATTISSFVFLFASLFIVRKIVF